MAVLPDLLEWKETKMKIQQKGTKSSLIKLMNSFDLKLRFKKKRKSLGTMWQACAAAIRVGEIQYSHLSLSPLLGMRCVCVCVWVCTILFSSPTNNALLINFPTELRCRICLLISTDWAYDSAPFVQKCVSNVYTVCSNWASIFAQPLLAGYG